MSTWREIKKQEDVELSEDGKTLEVLYMSDYNGNNYIDIPIEFVMQALSPQTDDEKWVDNGGYICTVFSCNKKASGVSGTLDGGYFRMPLCGEHWDKYNNH